METADGELHPSGAPHPEQGRDPSHVRSERQRHPERDEEEGARREEPIPRERDPRGLEQDHEPEPVRARADRRDAHTEVADREEVGFGSHRHIRRHQAEQESRASERGAREDAPQLLRSCGGSPREHADRDREERIRPATQENCGEPGRWSGDPERDDRGGCGRREHERDPRGRGGRGSRAQDRVGQLGGDRKRERLKRRGGPGFPWRQRSKIRPSRCTSSQHPPRRERAKDDGDGEPNGLDEPERRPGGRKIDQERDEQVLEHEQRSGDRPAQGRTCVLLSSGSGQGRSSSPFASGVS